MDMSFNLNTKYTIALTYVQALVTSVSAFIR